MPKRKRVAKDKEQTPIEAAPIEEAPIVEGTIEEGPNEEGPIDEGPNEEGPIDEGPIEERPIEEGPIEIYFCENRKKWIAQKSLLMVNHLIGYFDSEQLAADALEQMNAKIPAELEVDATAIKNVKKRKSFVRKRFQEILDEDGARWKSSAFAGVTWHAKTKKWMAHITMLGTQYHIGVYEKEEDAAGDYSKIKQSATLKDDASKFLDMAERKAFVRKQIVELLCKDKKKKSSTYSGVSWHGTTKKWMAHITIHGTQYHLGVFGREEDAAETYESIKRLHDLRGESLEIEDIDQRKAYVRKRICEIVQKNVKVRTDEENGDVAGGGEGEIPLVDADPSATATVADLPLDWVDSDSDTEAFADTDTGAHVNGDATENATEDSSSESDVEGDDVDVAGDAIGNVIEDGNGNAGAAAGIEGDSNSRSSSSSSTSSSSSSSSASSSSSSSDSSDSSDDSDSDSDAVDQSPN